MNYLVERGEIIPLILCSMELMNRSFAHLLVLQSMSRLLLVIVKVRNFQIVAGFGCFTELSNKFKCIQNGRIWRSVNLQTLPTNSRYVVEHLSELVREMVRQIFANYKEKPIVKFNTEVLETLKSYDGFRTAVIFLSIWTRGDFRILFQIFWRGR